MLETQCDNANSMPATSCFPGTNDAADRSSYTTPPPIPSVDEIIPAEIRGTDICPNFERYSHQMVEDYLKFYSRPSEAGPDAGKLSVKKMSKFWDEPLDQTQNNSHLLMQVASQLSYA